MTPAEVAASALPVAALAVAAARHPGLRLLVLHGSRARGEAAATSDWDFAYLAEGSLDVLALAVDLGNVLGSERIDLADLARASAVLRIRVATEGVPVFERTRGEHERFLVEASSFWCDVGPLVRDGYARALTGGER